MTGRQIHFFLGLGQGEKSQAWLEKRLPNNVSVHKAPEYLANQSEQDIHEIGLGIVSEAIADAPHGEYVICAESQAVPAVVYALMERRVPLPSQCILIQPLGCNYSALGSTPRARLRELLWRSVKFWAHPNQTQCIEGNRWTFHEILMDTFIHMKSSKRTYLYAANQDLAQTLYALAKTIPIHVYACSDDSLFPYSEIRDELRATAVTLHMVPGTHINRATPKGLRQILGILP